MEVPRRGDKGAAASRGERQNTAFKVRKDRPPPSFSLRSRILICSVTAGSDQRLDVFQSESSELLTLEELPID